MRELARERGPPAIAFDVHLDDGSVVDKPIDGGEGHSRVREDPVPFRECHPQMHRCERYILSQVVTNRDVSMYRFDSICFGRAG